MTIARAALDALLRQNVEIGLALNGREVEAADGYSKVPVFADQWKIRGNLATVEVRFGPVAVAVEYDAGAVFVNGVLEVLLPNKDGEVGRIPPRATLRYGAHVSSV